MFRSWQILLMLKMKVLYIGWDRRLNNFHPFMSYCETQRFFLCGCAYHGSTRQLKGRAGRSWDVEEPLKAVGPWRTAIHRYLSSLFFNHFSFIRRFEVVSDGTERRSGVSVQQKVTRWIPSRDTCLWRWLISTEHISRFPLIHVPCVNGYINICIHVWYVSCNRLKDVLRWSGEALNPYNETRPYNLFISFFITNSCHTLKSRLTISTDQILTFKTLTSVFKCTNDTILKEK